MEDLTSTASIFSKDELATMSRHVVIGHVRKILDIKLFIEDLVQDTSKTRDSIFTRVRELLFDMTSLWGALGPSRSLARRLYPDHQLLFDVLDKSLIVENVYEDLKLGRPFVLDKVCEQVCCNSQL